MRFVFVFDLMLLGNGTFNAHLIVSRLLFGKPNVCIAIISMQSMCNRFFSVEMIIKSVSKTVLWLCFLLSTC